MKKGSSCCGGRGSPWGRGARAAAEGVAHGELVLEGGSYCKEERCRVDYVLDVVEG